MPRLWLAPEEDQVFGNGNLLCDVHAWSLVARQALDAHADSPLRRSVDSACSVESTSAGRLGTVQDLMIGEGFRAWALVHLPRSVSPSEGERCDVCEQEFAEDEAEELPPAVDLNRCICNNCSPLLHAAGGESNEPSIWHKREPRRRKVDAFFEPPNDGACMSQVTSATR